MDAKAKKPKPTGRPKSGKHLLTLRLEPQIVEYYRSTGPGWLQRINDTLKRSMRAKIAAGVEQQREQ
jgi:uncharacterized protein (DUF4415 family)